MLTYMLLNSSGVVFQRLCLCNINSRSFSTLHREHCQAHRTQHLMSLYNDSMYCANAKVKETSHALDLACTLKCETLWVWLLGLWT